MAEHDGYGVVSTECQNDLFEWLERFGSHDQQYAVLLSTLVGFSKAIQIDVNQLQADIAANWSRIGAPDVQAEH